MNKEICLPCILALQFWKVHGLEQWRFFVFRYSVAGQNGKSGWAGDGGSRKRPKRVSISVINRDLGVIRPKCPPPLMNCRWRQPCSMQQALRKKDLVSWMTWHFLYGHYTRIYFLHSGCEWKESRKLQTMIISFFFLKYMVFVKFGFKWMLMFSCISQRMTVVGSF